MTCNGATTSLGYSDADQLLTEAYSGGTLAGLSMSWTYDNVLRPLTVAGYSGTNRLQSATNSYDAAGRLWKVTDGSTEAAYTYEANSFLLAKVALTNAAAGGLVTTRVSDRLGRLTSISSAAYGSGASLLPVRFGYLYNAANQRTRATIEDGSYWRYEYDSLGQVVAGRRYWADGAEVPGQQFTYGFDDIGNRETTGGRASAASTYSVNRLNRYSQRTVAAYVDVTGVANPTTNVTVGVGGQNYTATRRGDFFHHALNVPNSTAQYPTIEVTTQYGWATEAGEAFVPATPETYTYDDDGNLTGDGRWAYTWNGENRLIEMKRDVASPSGARMKLTFEYDAQGRRVRKTFSTHNGQTWVESRDTILLNDGWNVVAELDANASNARFRTYVWGSDLSGAAQGAGGVGGLLWLNNFETTCYWHTLPSGVHFAAYDGNGNVVALAKAADGIWSARYEYGPFGESVRVSGALGLAQPHRFSTKWTDLESGFLYYGYRYYDPSTGRWLSRDPLGERGGRNLYAFDGNDAVNAIDQLGLWGDHDVLTKTSFSELHLATTKTCKERLLDKLISANLQQDSVFISDLHRHFNRDPDESQGTARWGYYDYLGKKNQTFDQNVAGNTKGQCKHALLSLGHLLHSLQDFFAHAYHTTHGWDAWQYNAGGTPDEPGNLYPSSYPGEHPPTDEPISLMHPEYDLRRRATVAYVTPKMRAARTTWLNNAKCKCVCETAWWF